MMQGILKLLALPIDKAHVSRVWWLLGLLAALVAFPLGVPPYIRSLMIEVLIYAIFAISLDLLMGYTGLVSFGHAAFFGLGGYIAASSARELSANLLLTLPLVVVTIGAIAFAIGFFTLRTSGIYFLMLTLAFSQMFFGLASKWSAVTGGSDGLPVDRPHLGVGPLALGFGRDQNFYYLVLAMFLLAWWFLARLVSSPFGHTLKGIKENEPRMRSLGYHTWNFKISAFVIAGTLAGFAGMLLASFNRHVAPESLYWTASGQVIIMVLVGGLGTLSGPILGAALVHLLPSYASSYTERWQSILGLVFIAFVLFAPQGIAGIARNARRHPENRGLRTENRPTTNDQRLPSSEAKGPTTNGEPSDQTQETRDERRDPTGNLQSAIYNLQWTTDHRPPTTDHRPILHLDRLARNFGGLVAVDNVSLRVARGERRAMIGPNGAGKTTTFNLVSGEIAPASGKVYLDGQDVTGLATYERANLGLGRTFQRNNLFFGLSVFENVRLAVQHHQKISYRFLAPASRFASVNQAALDLLLQVGLADRRDEPVKALAYGQQRALEIALALASEPKVLLLDEPTAGMSPAETSEIVRLIAGLPRELTILIIEHDMDVIFSIADQITVLYYGQVLAEGTPSAIKENKQVQEVYLGTASKNLFGRLEMRD